MRRIVRLVIASVRPRRCRRASLVGGRADVGRLPRRSELPLGHRSCRNASRDRRRTTRSIIRLLVQWNLAAKTRPANATDPFDPAYEFDDIDEAVRVGAGERSGGDPDDLRHAALGERRQEPERHAHAGRRLHQLLARDRVALLGPVRGISVRALLVDLERAEPPAVPGAAVRLARPLGRPGELREARRRRVHGHQGGQPAGAGRDRRDVRPRQRQGRRASARRTHPASSPSSSRRRTRG